MKPLILLGVLILTGCGGVPPQSFPTLPPAAPIDLVSVLFRTVNRDIGPAIITDSIVGIRITRVADTSANDFTTHSIYEKSLEQNCILAVAEETWNRSPEYLKYIQTYPEKPCWRSLDPTVVTRIIGAKYFWAQFDQNNTQIGETYKDGTWDDLTIYSNGTLLECYKDTTLAKQPTDSYHVLAVYDSQGLQFLRDGNCNVK